MSGSKSVSVVNGKTSPGRGYLTLTSWLELHRTEPLQCEKGTIDTFFDNIGKYVIKNYHISTEKIKTADIITTCIQMVADDKTDKNITTKNVKAIHSEMENEINKANDLFRIYRYNFLEKLLQVAANEENQINNKIKEIGAPTKRVCLNEKCSKLFYCLKRKCDSCGGVVDKYHEEVGSQISYLYDVFNETEICENEALKNRPIIEMSEPIFLNPNNYKNIHHILKQLKIFAKIGINREWVLIGCDGPPYCLASRIIQSSSDEFDFAALVPGLGQLHMNQMKTILHIADDILPESLGKEVLNFSSIKAYDHFVNAKDTHKS